MQTEVAITNSCWKKLARPSEGGHRYFRWEGDDEHYGEVAIADDSGGTPDRTEDGTLWIDLNRKIEVGKYDHAPDKICASLPVISHQNGGQYHCGVGHEDLLWLLQNKIVSRDKVVVSESLRSVAAFFAELSIG